MFKTRIGFYDYHASRQIDERSARFAILMGITDNKSAIMNERRNFNDNTVLDMIQRFSNAGNTKGNIVAGKYFPEWTMF